MIASFPRAILHVDGDAFFTSVEQALVPSLRGKPVVTGKERGIIACASYEAKALGIKRGITLREAKKLCPLLTVLPSDYETYGLYSKRMFNIIRKYTPAVEEYSVDEAFADITGLRRLFRCSYEEIALKITEEIHNELNLTVSTGLSLSKSLAKLCSKFRKPSGFTAVPGRYIHVLLQKTPLDNIWGIGPSGVALLEKYGLRTAYDFVNRQCCWVEKMLHKPGREIWNELRGNSIWKVTAEEKTTCASIIKSKTFTPPSNDRAFVYAKLVRNMESAFMKARRYRLRPRVIGVVLRHGDFRHDGLEARLNRPTSSTLEVVPMVRKLFDRIFMEKSTYRATMVMLGALENDNIEQYELFEDRLKIESFRKVTGVIDEINRRYGKHTLCSATCLSMQGKTKDGRAVLPPRRQITVKGESSRRRLSIPRMDVRV
jgi:DNA polymerase-4/DNA polymerase V